jgi:Tfp pilus assembly protein PilZ
MPSAQDILREVFALNKRRTREGISPLEYQRWLDLSAKLRKEFPDHPPLGGRGETQIRVEFRDLDALRAATMSNVQSTGIFVVTPFAAEVGTKFGLAVFIKANGDEFRSRVEVVSNGVGPDYSTANLGMGMKFVDKDSPLRRVLDRLCGGGAD